MTKVEQRKWETVLQENLFWHELLVNMLQHREYFKVTPRPSFPPICSMKCGHSRRGVVVLGHHSAEIRAPHNASCVRAPSLSCELVQPSAFAWSECHPG